LSQKDVDEILRKYKTVAIVGLSRDPAKDSHKVGEYLKSQGFRIVPINPFVDEVLGEKSYESLLNMPVEEQRGIEIVDVFRPAVDVPLIVGQTIRLKKLYDVPHVVWMQIGIVNEEAANEARKAGLSVIMDKCLMREHRRIIGES